MSHVNKRPRTTDEGNFDCHGAPTYMLPSPETSESDIQTCSGDNKLGTTLPEEDFLGLPQELRDMIWKEALLEEDDLSFYNKFHHLDRGTDGTSRHRLQKKVPPVSAGVLLSTRPPTLAHVCRDVRKAALKHRERDHVRNGPQAVLGQFDSPPLFSRSALPLATQDYLNPAETFGYSIPFDDNRHDLYKSPSVLLEIINTWWVCKQFKGGVSHASDASLYQFLRNARDDQVMIVIPWIFVIPQFSLQRLSHCAFFFNQAPFRIPIIQNGEFDREYVQDVYVEARGSDVLRCIIQATDRSLVVYDSENNLRLDPHKSLADKDFLAEKTKNALAVLHDAWVEESRKALREGEAMPKVRFAIRFEVWADGNL